MDGGGNRIWRCRCSCGRTTEVAAHALRSGNTLSCGCHAAERLVVGQAHAAATSRRKGAVTRCRVLELLANGRTQAEAARALGVSRQRVHQILRGH